MENKEKALSSETERMINALEFALRAKDEMLGSLCEGFGDEEGEKLYEERYKEDMDSLLLKIKVGIGDSIADKMFCYDSEEL